MSMNGRGHEDVMSMVRGHNEDGVRAAWYSRSSAAF